MSPTSLRRYPLSRRLLIAADGGRDARRIRALAGASDWRREMLDRIGAAAVAVAGSACWPPAHEWSWPTDSPDEITGGLDRHIPGISIIGAVAPRQPGRRRLSLLCVAGGDEVIVKLGVPDDGIETETLALRLLSDAPLPGIATPSVIASGHLGEAGSVAFLATDAIGLDKQRPAIDVPLTGFEADLGHRLASLPRPPGTPDDAVPVHGDLAPWNLRRTPRGLALFDWEAAGWGPPGSDLAHYRAACASL